MTIQLSVAVRNARLDAIEAAIGPDPIMRIFDGSLPGNCAAADAGTVLAELQLPTDWLAAASSGSKAKSGTWQDASANATGTADYFRIYDAGSPEECHIQGTVTGGGGGGDMIVDNVNFASGQSFSVTSFTLTDGNA